MACAMQTFSAISQDQFNCLLSKAAAAGLPLNGNSGTASKSGFTIQWNYDPAASVLEIQCLSNPFFVPCSSVNGKIHDLVEECMAPSSTPTSLPTP